MKSDDTVRERVCDLRNTKEWVKFSFEGETAPTRSLPGVESRWWRTSVRRVAAALALILVAFGAGWFGHSMQEQAPQRLAFETGTADMHHVILHISDSDAGRFTAVLDKAEHILQQYQHPGVQVEVLASADGLDLMRTTSSRHTDSIKPMIASYENVRFIACGLGLKKLPERGLDATLVQGIHADQWAADHLIQRLAEGRPYINIQEPVGLRLILLRRRERGPNRPDFSLRRGHYALQNRDDLFSLSHSPRYEHLSPTVRASILETARRYRRA